MKDLKRFTFYFKLIDDRRKTQQEKSLDLTRKLAWKKINTTAF